MTYRLPLPPPRRADRSLLPAIICGLLCMAIALQLAVPRRFDLPEPGIVRPFHLDPPIVVARGPEPIVVQRALFGAGRTASAGAVAPVQPVDGATAAGVARRGGTVIAFVQAPGGAVTALPVGGRYHGWQLVRAETNGLSFRRGAQIVVLPFAAPQARTEQAAVPPAAAAQ